MEVREYSTSEAQRNANKRYYEKNKDSIKAKANKWLNEDPERRRALQREYYQRKKAKLAEMSKSLGEI